jgi:hypothetical protein
MYYRAVQYCRVADQWNWLPNTFPKWLVRYRSSEDAQPAAIRLPSWDWLFNVYLLDILYLDFASLLVHTWDTDAFFMASV